MRGCWERGHCCTGIVKNPIKGVEEKVCVQSFLNGYSLFKISDKRCSMEPGASPHDMLYAAEAPTQGIDALFHPGRDRVLRANEQLALAKAKGAKKTLLLLYCRFPWHPKGVKRLLANRDSSCMSGLDSIYRVKLSERRESRVWSSAESITPKTIDRSVRLWCSSNVDNGHRILPG